MGTSTAVLTPRMFPEESGAPLRLVVVCVGKLLRVDVEELQSCFGCLPFSQALVEALYVITSETALRSSIASKDSRARFGCLPFSNAVIQALLVITLGNTP